MKTYCFKLYKSERNEKLHKQINAAGLIYNHCIALHKRYYKIYGKYLKRNKLQKHLVKLKKLPQFSYLLEIGSQTVQEITDRIERAYNLFFKNLDESTHTLTVNEQNYRYFQSRRISGKIKTVTIKRDSLGDIYIYLVTTLPTLKSKSEQVRESAMTLDSKSSSRRQTEQM